MINCPKDRMFIIILDNGKRLPAVYVSEREYLIAEGNFSLFGNDIDVRRVPSQLGIPVGWEEL